MNKTCKHCSENFETTEDDAKFYERLDSPAPEFCPSCRMRIRLAHRNERSLYRRSCDLCKKEKISIYPPDTSFPVYCNSCWWSDDWDVKSFSLDWDPDRPFLEQFKELQAKVPRIGLLSLTSINSEYTNNSADNKNCYLLFAAEQNEDCLYGRLIQHCKSVVDACFVYDSELCYECIDCRQCYNCLFSEKCQTSTNLLFCSDVRDSQNCILSTNLRHKSYYIENKQYSKEDYEKKKKEILKSRENIDAAKKRFEKIKSAALIKSAFQTKCVNATGNYLFNCHDTRFIFDASNAKNCAYMGDAEEPIDFLDGNNVYYKPELCLDIMGTLQSYRSKHCIFIFYCSNMEYCDNCHNSNDCFGCIGLKKSSYCILNKTYPKEEYEKLLPKLIESMKKDGSYGSFFPPNMSVYGYNETAAYDFFPISKEEALKLGFRWQEKISGTYNKGTVPLDKTPGTI